MILSRVLAASLLCTAMAVVPTVAYAHGDVVHFLSDIDVGANTAVHDAVCFLCSVNAEGAIDGDVVVFFGDIHIANRARHDVVNFFGSVTAEDNAQIGNDLVSFFGLVRLGEDVSVGKDLVSMFGLLGAPASVTVGGNRVGIPAWVVLGPLAILGLIVFQIVCALRDWHWRCYPGCYPFPPKL